MQIRQKVIEKLQNLVDSQQKQLIAKNKSIDSIDKNTDKKINKIVTELANDPKNKQDDIPIGFIYTQLPNQSEPQILWPLLKWTDITEQYAGLFFRDEGKETEPFGKIQTGNSSTISNAMSAALVDVTYTKVEGRQYTLTKGWSPNLVPGKALSDFYIHISEGEVRPRNTAVRFWKRSA